MSLPVCHFLYSTRRRQHNVGSYAQIGALRIGTIAHTQSYHATNSAGSPRRTGSESRTQVHASERALTARADMTNEAMTNISFFMQNVQRLDATPLSQAS